MPADAESADRAVTTPTPARPMARTPLTDQVADALVALIDERQLSEGDVIPPTSELASLYGVSVPVVREAIASLAALGLISRQQGKESVVSVPDSRQLGRMLKYRVRNADVSYRSIQEFREIVEVGNAALAARYVTDDDAEPLHAAMEQLRGATTEDELHDADVRVHAAIATVGRNDLMIQMLDSLAPLLRQLRVHVWGGWVASGHELGPIVEAHAEIIERILARDEEGAAAAMRRHLDQARLGLEAEPE
jgi:DNA-binding FadR family transcriptional regulator